MRPARPVKKVFLALFLTVIIINLRLELPPVQAQNSSPAPIFILLAPQPNPAPAMSQLQAAIKAGQGQATHTFPGQAIIAQGPASMAAQLVTLPGVAAVYTGPVELATLPVHGPGARRIALVWNNLLSPSASPLDAAAQVHGDEPNDALTPPDWPAEDNLSAAGDITPGYLQTSEFMAGSVAVGVILVESSGQVDPSTENWTDDEKDVVFSEIVAALEWWSNLEPRAHLSFVYDDHFSNPLPTGYEPITRPYFHQQYWIADAMGALGFRALSYFTQVRDYNNHLRDTYQTDWAFTIFVVDSSADLDNRFSDGHFAYAYLGGPFLVMTSENNGYGPTNMDAVAAHEIGHIFLALDQYYSAAQPCTSSSGYLNIQNQNSQFGACTSHVTSIMQGQIYPYSIKAIDLYAAGQIGWRDGDGDGIFDPLDTDLPININSFSQAGNVVTVTGTARIIPYPSPARADITINHLTQVQYRLNQGSWQQANASDGTFDGLAEVYNLTTPPLPVGSYILQVAAKDSAGNMSAAYARQVFTVLDPVDGGLNTELYPINGVAANNAAITIKGAAYHLSGNLITGVEYRISGKEWQPAQATDGAFNSSYEAFSATIAPNTLSSGQYLVEARAYDNSGRVEANYASNQFNIGATLTTFFPFIFLGQ